MFRTSPESKQRQSAWLRRKAKDPKIPPGLKKRLRRSADRLAKLAHRQKTKISALPVNSWSWRVFFNGFWNGFGRFMAIFSACFIILPLFADTSSASFGSAIGGLLIAVVFSLIYGYSEGEDAVREWRYEQTEPRVGNPPSANSE
ncbi:MAG: hypothetical protein ACREB6_06435 [Rhodospirillales bacterium]